MKHIKLRQLVLSCILISLVSLANASDSDSSMAEKSNLNDSTANNSIDPYVSVLVKQVSDYLSTAKSYSVRSNATFEEVLPTGQKIHLSRTADVLVRQPDRLRAEVMSDNGIIRFYYDGKKMSRFDLDKNIYASIDVPGTTEKALDHAMEKFHLNAPLADLIAGNIYDNFIANTEAGFYVGLNYWNGNKYHHLALSNKNVDFQVWITDDTAPLIHKIIITYKHLKGAPSFTAILSDWNFRPRTPDMLFEFYPPADAEQIEFLPVMSSNSGGDK